ncbi:MAG: response regulator [Lachnospiraceae bacterium]|jgi:YesN/AraC family two-component response regulator|nr:response regulator [Lachnospiraceae bacterium]
MTVLIVDDETYMVEYMKNLVDWKACGFDQVLTAKGGGLARDLLAKYRPELLITDIKMPKITGLDLSRLIDENRYQTRVIIISGYSDFEYAKQALRYRVSEYLVKPVLREDLEEALERILPGSTKGGERGESEEQGPSRDKYAAVSSVKAYIHENYSQDLSLDALGDAVNLHPVYLSRIFKEVTDVNLSAYIADVRMQKAAKLLDETDLKVHEVMDKLGYRKRQHFTKLFKEKYGMTPKEYRMMKWNPQGTGPGNGGVKNK